MSAPARGSNPYAEAPPEAFWRTGVFAEDPLEISGLYAKKFSIEPGQGIATAGSCFAQHIAHVLRATGFTVMDAEPRPPGLSDANAVRFGYGVYSARYGNIYLVRQLLQLAEDAFAGSVTPDVAWPQGQRFVDALRPAVEPEGHASAEEVLFHRRAHLENVRRLFQGMDVFVFTFGLTEGWLHRRTGRVYPLCPGTVAGEFDAAEHQFHNFSYDEILGDFTKFHALIKSVNPGVRMILSVSPVPLIATASGQHVLAANTYSKAVLRAVAGDLAASHPDVDYFPAYELITSAASRSQFYTGSLREVHPIGVQAVMRMFLEQHAPPHSDAKPSQELVHALRLGSQAEADCEEVLLEAFAR